MYSHQDLNEGFVVSITIEARPGEAEAVGDLLEQLIAPTMSEPGVKLFLPYRSPTNPNLFHVFELYTNEAAWAAHEGTEHFQRVVPEVVARARSRERTPFVPYARLKKQ